MPRARFVSTSVTTHPPFQDIWNKVLLGCGIASSLLYAAMITLIRYEGYSLASHVPSELTAIGAPTRALWSGLAAIYTVLVMAFGWGLWKSAGRNRAAHTAGALILAYAALGVVWPFAPMHRREVLAAGGGTWSDTMHLVLAGVTVFLMFLAIGFGAAAFGRRFRIYSIATIVVLVAFGALTFAQADHLDANLPTPWIGLWERISISVFLVWVVALAIRCLRGARQSATGARASGASVLEPITDLLLARDRLEMHAVDAALAAVGPKPANRSEQRRRPRPRKRQ